MENMNFEEAMFIKNIQSELNYLHGMNTIKYNTRRLRALIYSGTGLREFVTCLKFAYSTFSKELGEIIDEFREYYEIPESENTKQVFIKMIEKINKMLHELYNDDASEKKYVACNVIDDIIELTKYFIKQCDRINEFTQLVYRVEASDETKYNKTTANDIVKYESTYVGSIDGDCKTLDEIMKTTNVDRNSQEFGKIICKRCKMIKNEVISLVNKYFGKNSKYSDFNIIQKIL